ncbi:hypothetical protein ABPG75_013742 [Micractinium tetrahymenae]
MFQAHKLTSAPGAAALHPAKAILRCSSAAAAPLPRRSSAAARAAKVSQAASAEQSQQQEEPQKDEVQPPEQFSVELPTADVQCSVQLMSVLKGRGAAIVVSGVEPGSAAAAAGVRTGQQLLAVSDPIRRTEMWELNAQASLRYTRQAIRMRVADSIVLRLTAQPIREWAEVVAAQRAAAAAQRAQQAQQAQQAAAARAVDDAAASGASVDVPDDLLTAVVQAAEAERSGSSFDEASPASPASAAAAAAPAASGSPPSSSPPQTGGRPLTVAERLEAEYAARQAAEAGAAPQVQRQLTDLERRQRRRKDYFEQASQRNDAPFFATMAAAFVVPPALILGIAWASGYLDSLDAYSLLK